MPVEEYITIDVYSYYTSTEEFSIATTYKGSEQSIFYATNHIRIFDHAKRTIVTAIPRLKSTVEYISRMY